MSKTERLYKIEQLIQHRGHVSFEALREALSVSPATIKRDLEYLRDRMGAPIEYDRFINGYRLRVETRGQKHELPGLWFNETELYSLLTTHQLLTELDGGGVLSRHLRPLLDRIYQALGTGESEAKELMKRVKIVSSARRPVPSQYFELVGGALVKRQRIQIRYFTRGRQSSSDREVSPLRLVHYRNTWYLDAWCHKTDALRRFALDAFEGATLVDNKAKEVSLKLVESHLDGGYGIFSGKTTQMATLVFSAAAAQWVSKEEWHPEQSFRWLSDGRFELKLPFAEATELVMDVLRHGPQVVVKAPLSLRAAVKLALEQALLGYE